MITEIPKIFDGQALSKQAAFSSNWLHPLPTALVATHIDTLSPERELSDIANLAHLIH
jgi:hypothetical protein